MSGTTSRLRIGDALLARGTIDEQELAIALAEQRRAHRPLGEILVGLGFARPEHVAEVVAQDLHLPFVRARAVQPDPVLVAGLDPDFARQTGAFPIALEEGALRVAMTAPDDPERVSLVRQRFPYPLQLMVVTADDLELLVRKHLQASEGTLAQLLRPSAGGLGASAVASAERLTDALIQDGVRLGATDIHIEPQEQVTRVRFRVDGLLRQGENLPRDVTDAVLSRIKVVSDLDIAERRLPQDGRVRLRVDGRRIDLRVSFMPGLHGENVVLRILDRSGDVQSLSRLGLPARAFRALTRVAAHPHGLFLVAGPTGSGKTTTLYSLLGEVDSIQRNVATIEDPVESELPLVRQSQVDFAAGFDFARGMRALLRQDPDVILVGEIRDAETVDIAVKASMTGHLVLATLHTNTAIGAIARLLDLGVAPYLIGESLVGALGQRLVRRVCEACAQEREPSAREREVLGQDCPLLREGAGCAHCGGTGYAGRIVIGEVFLADAEIAEAIGRGATSGELRALADARGFEPLHADGLRKVKAGITTLEEVERVGRDHRIRARELEDL